MSIIEHLAKYSRDTKIISQKDLSLHKEVIPQKWFEILNETNFETVKNNALNLWRNIVGVELSNTISYMNDYLLSLNLLLTGTEYSLLYGVKYKQNRVSYYEGKFSLDLNKNINLKNNWTNVPQDIRKFYEELHNGFYYHASQSMGLSSVDKVTYFVDPNFYIIEEYRELVEINLETTFGFFTNGIGGYVAIDIKLNSSDKAVLWLKDKHPKYNIKFWDFVDEWIVIGMDN